MPPSSTPTPRRFNLDRPPPRPRDGPASAPGSSQFNAVPRFVVHARTPTTTPRVESVNGFAATQETPSRTVPRWDLAGATQKEGEEDVDEDSQEKKDAGDDVMQGDMGGGGVVEGDGQWIEDDEAEVEVEFEHDYDEDMMFNTPAPKRRRLSMDDEDDEMLDDEPVRPDYEATNNDDEAQDRNNEPRNDDKDINDPISDVELSIPSPTLPSRHRFPPIPSRHQPTTSNPTSYNHSSHPLPSRRFNIATPSIARTTQVLLSASQQPTSTQQAQSPFNAVPKFKLPEEEEKADVPEPLPDQFSPRRRGHRFVSGGLAEAVRGWLVEAENGASHIAQHVQVGSAAGVFKLEGIPSKPGGLKDEYLARVIVEGVSGGAAAGMCVIHGTLEGRLEEVRVILGGGVGLPSGLDAGREATVRCVVGIKPPIWTVDIGGENYAVGAGWRIL